MSESDSDFGRSANIFSDSFWTGSSHSKLDAFFDLIDLRTSIQ